MKSRRRLSRGVGLFLGGTLLLFASDVYRGIRHNLSDWRLHETWPEVDVWVVSRDLTPEPGSDQVRLHARVEGTYDGRKLRADAPSYTGSRAMLEQLFPLGAPLVGHVDPDEPHELFVPTGHDHSPLVLEFLPAILLAAGALFLIVRALWPRRSK